MKKVQVLISTYNGEKYLIHLLDSVLNQKNVEVSIFVRDDGSTDGTVNILNIYSDQGKLKWYSGKNKGAAFSFLDLLSKSGDYDYYAFCDQDDIWLQDKLYVAVSKLEAMGNFEKPQLYYGCPRLVDNSLRDLPIPKEMLEKYVDFSKAFVRSNCFGCTMVFNRELKQRIKIPDFVTMHDEWVHKICLLFDGAVFFDDDVHILYRQHGDNTVGVNTNLLARAAKFARQIIKKDRNRSKLAKEILRLYGNEIDLSRKRLLIELSEYNLSILNKVKLLLDRRFCVKYYKKDIMFKFAVCIGAL